jgi:hypothetical protein
MMMKLLPNGDVSEAMACRGEGEGSRTAKLGSRYHEIQQIVPRI